jgi:hypothetical protein
MNTRLFFLSLLLVIATVILFASTPSGATQSGTIWTWCASEASTPIVYFSRPFDSGLSAHSRTLNSLSLARQFSEYLKGRFDVKTNAFCGSGVNGTDQAAASQRVQDMMAEARRQNKQVVELSDWNYIRDEVAIKASFNTELGGYVNVEGGLPADHIYCVTGSSNNTIYYTEPIRMTNPSYNPSVDYFRFLQQKYSFKGADFSCPILNEPQEKLYLNARLAGARAGGKQIVNTGWPPAASTTAAEVPNDRYQDNAQPAQKPTANQPSPSAQVRNIAAKEVSAALVYCHNNNVIGRGFDCACLQVKIYEYRIAHPADTLQGTPALASFFDGKLFDCDKCVNAYLAKDLARNEANRAGLKTSAAQDCAAEKFVAALHANPIPSRTQEALAGAIKACR